MTTTTAERARRGRTALAALALTVLTTAGCAGTEAPEPAAETPAGTGTTAASRTPDPGDTAATDGAPAYDGPYDDAFRAELSTYAGQQVRLSGEVGELIRSRSAFVITAPGAPDVAPLLVSARYAVPEIEQGDVVEVTGTVREDFEPPVAGDAVGGEEEPEFYAEHVGEPYLDEATVEPAS
jgi:hypothetical protein